ncbi:DUF1289 domain-containing protein [Acinetobacter gerneri]|uniref:Fe-S protein n=2 Tax=Acinetobacter gerneri TaxID=202952 RepID=N8ZUA3_9GAMM|nr:DUF1289 domain-containing protein [Acinetobacter gerneri]ENV35035.1 hypothetical protein F960_00685 [Acinetobacter gerneri DSM 14967 = CIP 107464 = MTCC 9824]EPR82360.1 hypothetical protein L289_3008 [Acinetobacter gerneri DSM 14967 = CIP 107464 = MTCC 9824]MCH4245466.1 DUF1289 domain-containing protein [Acinetobacter gerneri]MDQ9009844.1 DUF1289 domain-containing protein [Acinetobacter gerneri]MDQ9013914.1 DUF1289 domain-containing protein [Acinetobacter gerneri]
MTNDRRIPSLTPCAGRCSTVFGDHVCRGCRRFNHEVIQWNTYSLEQRMAVWRRLDAQLDQILVPMLPLANLQHVEGFISSKRVRVMQTASKGRKLYHALKICEKNKNHAEESGLGILPHQVKPIWTEFERRVLALAKASYDFAWLRADGISQSLLHLEQV